MHTTSSPCVLLLADDDALSRDIGESIHAHFHDACLTRCRTISEALRSALDACDVVLCEQDLPDGSGLDALERLRDLRDDVSLVMMVRPGESGAAVEAIRRGAADFIVRSEIFLSVLPAMVEKCIEASRMRRDNLRLQTALASSLAELKRKNRELEESAARFENLASIDPLTGLANRRRMQGRLQLMFSEAVRYSHDLACMMIDLDGFKSINDTLGHQRGDDLLAMTGRLIEEQIRMSDLGARFGGDEFVVALPHTSCDTAVTLARRLQAGFRRDAAALAGVGIRCGMSVGISCLRLSRPESPQEMISHADNALYSAKQGGRGGIMVCGEDGVTAEEPERFLV